MGAHGPAEIRFWRFVDKTAGCWLWTGAIVAKTGYGRFNIGNGQVELAHRFSYIMHYKQNLSKDMYVCHTCDNPACVNPGHLFVGNNQANLNDCKAKGKLTQAKLTETDVLEIRRLTAGLTRTQVDLQPIADKYNVSVFAIRDILRGRTWTDV